LADSFTARLDAAEAERPGRFGTETYEGDLEMTNVDPHTTAPQSPTLRERAYASAEVLRSTIEDGLDTLPDAAKARIRAAREAAISAQSQVDYHARRAASAARETARENPLLLGALAFAAGAVVAAALPRSSVENRTIGAQRDRLFDEADRVFRAEVAAAKSAARDAMAKGQSKVKEAIGDAADAVRDTAEEMKHHSTTSANGASGA
jgi:gas vesicle protein